MKILREVLFFFLGALILFLAFSTIVQDETLCGSFGAGFAQINTALFGYLALLYPFALLFGLYRLYQNGRFDSSRLLFLVSTVWLFILFLILQARVADGVWRGYIGELLLDAFTPILGRAGLWIIWAGMFALCMALLSELSFTQMMAQLKKWFFSIRLPSLKLPKREPKQEIKKEEAVRRETAREVYVEEEPIVETVAVKHEPHVEPKEQPPQEEPPFEPDSPAESQPIESPLKPPKKKSEKSVEIIKELEENRELLRDIELGERSKPKGWKLPLSEFFAKPPAKKSETAEEEIDAKIAELIDKLRRFKIEGDVIRTYTGPVVTTFEFKPAAHIKVSRILTLQDDIAMALKAQSIRIQAPIPGKDVVGVEIPNQVIQTIYMRELLESELFAKSTSPLTLILGKDIVGNAFVTDLKKLPHLLIAGTTGSGKSVGINAMILSLLYKNSPEELRLLMIDPKMLEFSMYNDIPHLLTPVITKPKQAINALANMVAEMERRYLLMSKTKTKNIENFNEKAHSVGEEKMPYIVVIIDELADLMMTSGKEVELSIARLAQMARASGIHLIVATQRPSVDVVTGLIKANLPSRVSFKVGQKIDSKVILDQMGAESLLGRGDMLFTPPGMSGVVRLHAPWSSEAEIEKVVDFLKAQKEPDYDESFLMEAGGSGGGSSDGLDTGDLDEMYEEAKQIVLSERKTSISYIQRRLQIGYNRAARIVEQLEATGVISQANNKGAREVL